MKTGPNNLADIEFQLQWKSHHGIHTDCYFARRVNFWRDVFPKTLCDSLMNRSIGDVVEVSFEPGAAVQKPEPAKLFRIRHSQFDEEFHTGTLIRPRRGRYYPKGMLRDVGNVFSVNIEPFRLAEIDDSGILVDFNHPLAGTAIHLRAIIRGVESKRPERGGGMCKDWMETITGGPGMQVRWNGHPTEFLSDNPFERTDKLPDSEFYRKPRFVNHIDRTAIGYISGLYKEVLSPDVNVLDLMSSWQSHLPRDLELARVTGLGLNREELEQNERLTDFVIHDLNENPVLPFGDESYDAVICTVSVEYLTNPLAVFREVGRILRPGGCLMLTFSNRWFPPKVITIWQQLHEFERMGLVSEYFFDLGRFGPVQTHSMRNLSRPEDDKYAATLSVSDPVYAVWAYKN